MPTLHCTCTCIYYVWVSHVCAYIRWVSRVYACSCVHSLTCYTQLLRIFNSNGSTRLHTHTHTHTHTHRRALQWEWYAVNKKTQNPHFSLSLSLSLSNSQPIKLAPSYVMSNSYHYGRRHSSKPDICLLPRIQPWNVDKPCYTMMNIGRILPQKFVSTKWHLKALNESEDGVVLLYPKSI